MTFSFVDNEKQVLEFWAKHDIFKQSMAQNKQSQPYVSYDGPPFATGLPHHGHLLASTIKDVVLRYFTQQGYYVDRRFGWDCHGIPIEHEINKSLNLQPQAALEKLGVAGYNQACRDIVMRYREQWKSTITRLGRWVDFEEDYKTMDSDFMESVWWVFGKIWDKGLIYEGTKVVPFSTSLGTGLSNFEASSNYQMVQDPAITVLFTLTDASADLAIWTTTPWTLPANQAIAVSQSMTYCLIEIENFPRPVWMAESSLDNLLKKVRYQVLKTIQGSELTGLRYQPLFHPEALQGHEATYQVLEADFIEEGTGTGLVHMAPQFGEDDHRICQQHGIHTVYCPIQDDGTFDQSIPSLAGLYIKDADKVIIRKLDTAGHLLTKGVIEHSYPFCPRSDTPLIYKAIPSWFIAVEKIKERLIHHNQSIHWVPSHIQQGRFGKWLENARDWAISRNLVWGTPIPLWRNQTTGNIICIDSKATLQRYTNVLLDDLHREHVDPLSFSIPGEEGVYERVSEVLDCWFESGAMPYAQAHYPFANAQAFEDSFPAEFIAEGLDQTRGWFYTLNILSTILFDQPAFKNVIVNGIVVAKDGKKMSKRLKNYTPPDELMETYGADCLRLYLIGSNLVKGEEQRFSDQGVKEVIRSTLLPWYNAYQFFHTYANIDQWQCGDKNLPYTQLDRWIQSRLQSLIECVNTNMKTYQLNLVVPPLLKFIDELTNTYIRMNRNRFWGEAMSADKQAAYQTLFDTLVTLSKLMAPFTPFLAESTFQSLKTFDPSIQSQSVHLTTYPIIDQKKQDKDLEMGVKMLQEVINMARAERTKHQIKTKTPLASITIIHSDPKVLKTIELLSDRLLIELNVKAIHYDHNESHYVSLNAKPNLPVIGKHYGPKLKQVKLAIEHMSQSELQAFEKGQPITKHDFTFNPGDLLIIRQIQTGISAVSNQYITISLDTELTPELILEGQAREVVSQIQQYRKQQNLAVTDRITLTISQEDHLQAIFSTHSAYILGEVLALNYQVADTPQQQGFQGIEGSFSIEAM